MSKANERFFSLASASVVNVQHTYSGLQVDWSKPAVVLEHTFSMSDAVTQVQM